MPTFREESCPTSQLLKYKKSLENEKRGPQEYLSTQMHEDLEKELSKGRLCVPLVDITSQIGRDAIRIARHKTSKSNERRVVESFTQPIR